MGLVQWKIPLHLNRQPGSANVHTWLDIIPLKIAVIYAVSS